MTLVGHGLTRLIYREQDGHFTHFLYTADDERILRFGTGGFSWSLRDFQGHVLRKFRPESNRLQPIRDHIYRGASSIATVTVDENDILSRRHHLSLDHLAAPATSPTVPATSSPSTNTIPSAKKPPSPPKTTSRSSSPAMNGISTPTERATTWITCTLGSVIRG